MQWYYAENNQPVGPLSEEDFQSRVSAGNVTPQTLVWCEGMPAWKPYEQVAPAAPVPVAVAAAPTPTAVSVCCECKRHFPLADMIQYQGVMVCAQCKPTFFQRVEEGAQVETVMIYAGFWIRFVAKFIDGLILGAVGLMLAFVAMAGIAGLTSSPFKAIAVQVIVRLVQLAIGIAYTTYFLGRHGATPGKMALRLRVVRSDGSPLTYGRACGRHFAEMLSSVILLIGYIMAAFDDEKRALHDRICDTRVIQLQ